ncbi:DUF4097 domain-containing protein [Puniceicoccaceae bacterium K14]|nr:DUF4097 domain-containing protein [Puniceicoccaceae bacterium K14]
MKAIKTLSLSILLSIFATSQITASEYTEVTEKSFDAAAIRNLEIKTIAGYIKVFGEEREDISITRKATVRNVRESRAKAYLENIETETTIDGETLAISYQLEDKPSSISISLELRLPQNIVTHLKTSGGSIRVEDMDADVTAKTSGGNMTFNQIKANLTARTSGGDIKVDNVSMDANIHTSGGNLSLKNLNGNVTAKTSGGYIEAEILNPITKNSSFKTSGGNIKLKLVEDSAFHLAAQATGGRIHSDFKVDSQVDDKSRSIEGNVNGGGPDLELKTSGGNIHIIAL